MAELPWLGHDTHARKLGCPVGDAGDHLDDVVDVALGVRATGDGKAYQVHGGGYFGAVRAQAEHHGSDLAATHPAFGVQRAGQGLTRVLQRVEVGQHGPRVDEHRLCAGN